MCVCTLKSKKSKEIHQVPLEERDNATGEDYPVEAFSHYPPGVTDRARYFERTQLNDDLTHELNSGGHQRPEKRKKSFSTTKPTTFIPVPVGITTDTTTGAAQNGVPTIQEPGIGIPGCGRPMRQTIKEPESVKPFSTRRLSASQMYQDITETEDTSEPLFGQDLREHVPGQGVPITEANDANLSDENLQNRKTMAWQLPNGTRKKDAALSADLPVNAVFKQPSEKRLLTPVGNGGYMKKNVTPTETRSVPTLQPMKKNMETPTEMKQSQEMNETLTKLPTVPGGFMATATGAVMGAAVGTSLSGSNTIPPVRNSPPTEMKKPDLDHNTGMGQKDLQIPKKPLLEEQTEIPASVDTGTITGTRGLMKKDPRNLPTEQRTSVVEPMGMMSNSSMREMGMKCSTLSNSSFREIAGGKRITGNLSNIHGYSGSDTLDFGLLGASLQNREIVAPQIMPIKQRKKASTNLVTSLPSSPVMSNSSMREITLKAPNMSNSSYKELYGGKKITGNNDMDIDGFLGSDSLDPGFMGSMNTPKTAPEVTSMRYVEKKDKSLEEEINDHKNQMKDQKPIIMDNQNQMTDNDRDVRNIQGAGVIPTTVRGQSQFTGVGEEEEDDVLNEEEDEQETTEPIAIDEESLGPTDTVPGSFITSQQPHYIKKFPGSRRPATDNQLRGLKDSSVGDITARRKKSIGPATAGSYAQTVGNYPSLVDPNVNTYGAQTQPQAVKMNTTKGTTNTDSSIYSEESEHYNIGTGRQASDFTTGSDIPRSHRRTSAEQKETKERRPSIVTRIRKSISHSFI